MLLTILAVNARVAIPNRRTAIVTLVLPGILLLAAAAQPIKNVLAAQQAVPDVTSVNHPVAASQARRLVMIPAPARDIILQNLPEWTVLQQQYAEQLVIKIAHLHP